MSILKAMTAKTPTSTLLPSISVTVIFGAFVNILMLAGPLFMIQVYDRVLASRSKETLVALLVLVGLLYLFMALLDASRARVLARGQMTEAEFKTIRDRQIPDAEKRARADYVIDTSQGLEQARAQVDAVIADLKGTIDA